MGEVVAFPLHRRTSLVREASALVAGKSPEAATRYWRMTMRRLLAELQIYGLSPDEIDHQLRGFASAVLAPRMPTYHGDDAA